MTGFITTPTGDAKRWQRRKAARPGEIIDAAIDVFSRKGYAAARLEEIAREAGLTKGTVYLYFDSKEALFKAVVREAVVPALQFDALARLIAENQGKASELLKTVLTQWAHTLSQARPSALAKLMIAEATNFPELAAFCYAEVVLPSRRLFGDIIRRGVATGEFAEVDIAHAARAVVAPLLSLSLWQHSLGQHDADGTSIRGATDTCVALLVAGLQRGVSETQEYASPLT